MTANGGVFAFVAHADTSILAGISKGNDANTLLQAVRLIKYKLQYGT